MSFYPIPDSTHLQPPGSMAVLHVQPETFQRSKQVGPGFNGKTRGLQLLKIPIYMGPFAPKHRSGLIAVTLGALILEYSRLHLT